MTVLADGSEKPTLRLVMTEGISGAALACGGVGRASLFGVSPYVLRKNPLFMVFYRIPC
jgi:hypothetical protein